MRVRSAIAGIAALGLASTQASAQRPELVVWTTRAIATVLAEVGPEFERTSGITLKVTSDLPPAFRARAAAGEPFDILISGAAPVDEWIRDGKLLRETRTTIGRSGIGVEVRGGAPKPDISSVNGLKRTLLAAKSVAYLRVGSGIYLDSLLERIGIAAAIKSKAIRPETDVVSELVAKGKAEIGMVVITQILTTRGVELVGPLPPEIQSYVTFAAGVSARSAAPAAARRLIEYLTGPTAVRVIRSQGMDPEPRR
jgi:molybdate transport system substrate-binding protein